jgi:hypothetical protein
MCTLNTVLRVLAKERKNWSIYRLMREAKLGASFKKYAQGILSEPNERDFGKICKALGCTMAEINWYKGEAHQSDYVLVHDTF